MSLKTELVIDEVMEEVEAAAAIYPPFHSPHEGYGVILDELDGLWEEIKNGDAADTTRRRKKAVQLAAMAIRFILDVSE